MNRYELTYIKPREIWGRKALLNFRPNTWHLAFQISVFARTEAQARQVAAESFFDTQSMSPGDFAREEDLRECLLDKTPENWLDPGLTACTLVEAGVETVQQARKGAVMFHEVPWRFL